jgi:hypothetical protein
MKFLEIFSKRTGLNFYSRIRALISGKQVYYIIIKSGPKYFFADSLEQAKSKRQGHEVFKV